MGEAEREINSTGSDFVRSVMSGYQTSMNEIIVYANIWLK